MALLSRAVLSLFVCPKIFLPKSNFWTVRKCRTTWENYGNFNLRIPSYNFIPFLRRWAFSLDMDKPKAVFATMQTFLRLSGFFTQLRKLHCVHCDDHFFIFISFPQFIHDLLHISLTLFWFVKKVIYVTVVFLRERSQERRTASWYS